MAEREPEFLRNFRAAFKEGNRAWNEGEFETFPDARADLGEFVEAGDETVVVELRVSGTGASSEARTAMEIWQVWEMPGGMPVRVREFRDRRSALDAARAGQTTERPA